MHPLLAQREFRFREQLLESTLNDACRWACKRRFQAFDGDIEPYSIKDYPYLRGIYASKAPCNYIMKGAQMGLTELAINISLYVLCKLRKNAMYVLPTGEEVEEFSRTRVMVAVKQSAFLLSVIDPTIRTYQHDSFTLYMRGAKKDHNLKSVPVTAMILDEVDEVSDRAIQLALERLSGQSNPYLLMLSTPTYPGFGIDAKYQESTRNHFFFRCGGCNKKIELLYPESFVLCGDSESDLRTRESHWKCVECGRKIDDREKIELFARTGGWESTNKGANPEYAGWWIHQGYSPKVTAARFAAAVHASRRSADAKRELYNSKLALPYSDDGAQITDKIITDCLKGFTRDDGAKLQQKELRILGADPGNPLYYAVCAFRFDPQLTGDVNDRTRSRLIAYGYLPEDTCWAELYRIFRDYGCRFAAMDIGGDARGSRSFTRRLSGFAMPVRYVTGRPARDINVIDEEEACPVANVDRDNWLAATYNRFYDGRIELPSDITPEFRQHLKALVRETKVGANGVRSRVFRQQDGKEDHWAHALNYCELGLRLFELYGVGAARSDKIS
jgi:hypothetical protein